MRKPFILSIGGSLVAPAGVDTAYLRKLRSFLLRRLRRGERFVLVVGGGMTARNYIKAAANVAAVPNEDKDWLGIHATRINAHLLRTIMRGCAHPAVVKDPTRPPRFREGVLVAAGWKPGFSTDYDAVMLAKAFSVKEVYNLTNVDYVYDKDPKKGGAKRLPLLTWRTYRKMIPKWKAGLNAPFDPIASREAQRSKMAVAILDGHDLANLGHALDGKRFKGTLISPP